MFLFGLHKVTISDKPTLESKTFPLHKSAQQVTNYQKYGSIYMTFKKGDAIIDVEPGDNSRFEITTISFPDVDFGDFREIDELTSILMRDKSSSYNSCKLEDSKHHTIYYPKLSLRRTWDVNRVVKEINNYLDNIINIVIGYNNVEEFI